LYIFIGVFERSTRKWSVPTENVEDTTSLYIVHIDRRVLWHLFNTVCPSTWYRMKFFKNTEAFCISSRMVLSLPYQFSLSM